MSISITPLAALACAESAALAAGDLDALGALLGRHWDINKRMDAGCTNSFIEGLFAACAPYLVGAKLAGAGGGGFVLGIARDADAVPALDALLAGCYAGGEVRRWECDVAPQGLIRMEDSV